MTNIAEVLHSLMFPHSKARIYKIKEHGYDFAHYTSAEVATSIIRHKEIWMRSAAVMNDSKEVVHGQELIKSIFVIPQVEAKLKELNSNLLPRSALPFEVFGAYPNRDRVHHCHVLSLSEHGEKRGSERTHGRLSMWRAYGGMTNVAMVFNAMPVLAANPINAYLTPVIYGDVYQVKAEVERLLDGMLDNVQVLQDYAFASDDNSRHVLTMFFMAVEAATVSIKHPAFMEEREWRVVRERNGFYNDVRHYTPKQRIVTVNGVPQRISVLPLVDEIDGYEINLGLPRIFKEILIGHTPYSETIRDALVEELEAAGIPDAHERVIMSDVPLRR